jgi:hypothetical protein
LQDLAAELDSLLRGQERKATPMSVLEWLLPEVAMYCPNLADTLEALKSIYATTVKGDYVEAALGKL